MAQKRFSDLFSAFVFLMSIVHCLVIGGTRAQSVKTSSYQEKVNIPSKTWSRMWSSGNENLTLAQVDENVAFYFQSFHVYKNSSFKIISAAWKYVTDTYGPFGNHAILTIVLHEGVSANGHCISSNEVSFTDEAFGNRHVIDCGASIHSTWNPNKPGSMDEIITQIGRMTLKLSKGIGNWPARSFARWEMTSILVYDIFLGLKMAHDMNRWMKTKIVESSSYPVEGTYWFRDWYFQLYQRHGGSVVFNDFFSLLLDKWPKRDRIDGGKDYVNTLNMGEYLHFWSEAADKDLRDVVWEYLLGFHWNQTYQNQFNEARMRFSTFNYSCLQCDQFPGQTQGTSDGILVPSVIVSVCALILIASCIGFGMKIAMDRKRMHMMSQQIRNLTEEEVDEFREGNSNVSQNDAHAPIHSLPFNKDFEIPKERLIIDQDKVLGSGEFGVVLHGVIMGEPENGVADVEVAVKMVKPNVEISYFKALLSEIKIMAHLGAHENIVSLLGTVTTNIINREVYVALEFCLNGDLLKHLTEHRQSFVNLWKDGNRRDQMLSSSKDYSQATIEQNTSFIVSYENSPMSTLDLINWSHQIANGMAYLSSNKVIHGDLAARNVLLTLKNVAKISDFGLSRQLINYSNYLKTSHTPLPWRWLAIESLNYQTFSVDSDIWSFGVTLWEIFTLGKVPYPGRTWDNQFVAELSTGQRLIEPEFGNQDIYNLMLNCMHQVPTERITFPQIKTQLGQIKTRLTTTSSSVPQKYPYLSLA